MSPIQQFFLPRFSTLTPTQWQQAFTDCQLSHSANASGIDISDQELTRLATYLTLYYTDTLEPQAHHSDAWHIAKKLLYFSSVAASAIEQVQKSPQMDASEALQRYQLALHIMAEGDARAHEIIQAFAFRSSSVMPQLASPTGAALAPSTRRTKKQQDTLVEQWAHLQQWFKQTNDPMRPWNVSEIGRQLKINQSMMRALLTAPKGTPGVSRTAYSVARLRRLQRHFRPYGYQAIASAETA